MKKIFRKIHLWLSVPFGLIITLVCFSGAMLVFENEANEWFRRDLYYVETVKESPLPMDKLLEKVATTLTDSVSVTGVSISSDPGRAYQVSLSKPRRASLYVDQYTGEVKGKSERSGFFMFMFRMHRWLLDSMNPGNEGIFWGKMIVGVSTLLLVFVLISGIVIWWPRTRKALKNSLKITATKGWRRFWYDLHVAGGMYALIFLLAMALTGLTWSFPWYRTAFYKVFGVEVQQRAAQGHEQKSDAQKRDTKLAAHREKKREGNDVRKGERSRRPENNHSDMYLVTSPFVYWQEIYDKLRRQNPEYKQISISSGTASVSFNRFGNQRASDRYSFNTDNGEFTETSLYQHQDKSGKIRGWIYSVHVGNWGGMFTRILTFIAALLGAALPLTGYYLWIKRLIKVRK
ncbi:PepSY-associated TM helix domain-containing protein [Bacteroides ovatus]|uniref:PepSY-associated TM helix domain-containing protein n=1 Tax=Bacteroides ovatus TaxID=28116 RepID=UPI00202FA500|nr:PepSY-associated TM helix domain-containing protein [Bacteroides ovatus]MCM1723011.1 PepSY domain-containing protein [Bacteroides ovatus]MCM1757344.1 PepSY domain-containing protein [Bacteroides ovatus]MCM1868590.1 PepSY domain-containing protein [Bacteroides ovatus]MCM1910145.1 PepSY domain-containing protein [Bacteroides ovatus]